uniref:Histamine N-methyltransferase n=2 Tax=Ornithorhynchus anatinus TaxID=9258 RepID=A0A6I8N9N2_ORNAN
MEPEREKTRYRRPDFEAQLVMPPCEGAGPCVRAPMRSLTEEEYAWAFKAFLDRSTEHQCMEEFNTSVLPGVIARIGDGKSTINVLGVGSGPGEQDLKMLRVIQECHPGRPIDTDVIEPNAKHIGKFKALVGSSSGLENVKFHWHQLTAEDHKARMQGKAGRKEYHFIHLVQMLYRVDDIAATIKFFYSCLAAGGKLLIIILSGSSGWAGLWRSHQHCLPSTDSGHYVTSLDIQAILRRLGLEHRVYDLPSRWDITECFAEGDKVGGLMLDFLTGTKDFRDTAPLDLKTRLREALRRPECSSLEGGRVMFNNNLSMIVVPAPEVPAVLEAPVALCHQRPKAVE